MRENQIELHSVFQCLVASREAKKNIIAKVVIAIYYANVTFLFTLLLRNIIIILFLKRCNISRYDFTGKKQLFKAV